MLNVNNYTFLSKNILFFEVFNTCGKLLWKFGTKGMVKLHKKLYRIMYRIHSKGRFRVSHFIAC